MAAVSFVIPSKPFGKQRARATRMGRVFTPKETVAFEAVVREVATGRFQKPLEGPVRLTIEAVFAVPPSWSSRKRAAALRTSHVGKPDLDNCMKALGDGLNRIAFADDSQVAEAVLRKRWGEAGETRVTVETIEDAL